nr:OB-fold domain-containing protein [Mycobacterium sp. E342]
MAIFLHQGSPAPGVDYSTPYPVVTIELDEQRGLRFTSTVVGAPNDAIRIGARVNLAWIDRHGSPMPVFELSDTGS